MGYHILDYDIELVSEFGLCYKNKLPKELQRRLFTRKQWLEKGFILKDGAREYPMHSQKNYRNRVIYYLDTDVVKMDGNDIPKNCLTCNYRSEQSFCVIVGDYVGEINRCSEWEGKYAK